MSVTNHSQELCAFFADLIRDEAAEALALAPLLSEAETLRYQVLTQTTARHVTSIEVEDQRIAVTVRVNDWFHTRRFGAEDLLAHLEQAIQWATAKERRAWAELPVIE
jgi:hypothetical protein